MKLLSVTDSCWFCLHQGTYNEKHFHCWVVLISPLRTILRLLPTRFWYFLSYNIIYVLCIGTCRRVYNRLQCSDLNAFYVFSVELFYGG